LIIVHYLHVVNITMKLLVQLIYANKKIKKSNYLLHS
jgi:hypothetical protein